MQKIVPFKVEGPLLYSVIGTWKRRSTENRLKKATMDPIFFPWETLRWTAPEILWAVRTSPIFGPVGTQKGDIYSLGIIMQVN